MRRLTCLGCGAFLVFMLLCVLVSAASAQTPVVGEPSPVLGTPEPSPVVAATPTGAVQAVPVVVVGYGEGAQGVSNLLVFVNLVGFTVLAVIALVAVGVGKVQK